MTWKRVATAAVLIPFVVGLVLWASTAIVAVAVALVTLELGATHCLRKPFTPKALLAAINDCLAKPTMSAQQSKK